MHASPANIAGSRITPVGIKAAAVPTRNRVLTAKTTDFDKLTLLPVKQPFRQKRLGCFPAYKTGAHRQSDVSLVLPLFSKSCSFFTSGA
jgi:hypothetical protein